MPLALDNSEFSRSLAILPDAWALILGTNTHLRLYCTPRATRNRLSRSLCRPPQASRLRIGLRLADRGLGIGDINAFVNDRNAGRLGGPEMAESQASATIEIPLDPGQNTIQLRVYDKSNTVFVETAPLDVTTLDSGAGDHGRLFVLAVGIDHFALRL